MNEDGKVVIGTMLDTKGFEKKYKQLETRLKNAELNLEIKSGDLENARKELFATQQELTKIKNIQDEINDTISKKQKQYDRLNEQINSNQPLTGEEYQRFGFLENTLAGLRSKQAEINKEFDMYNEKVNKANDLLTKTETKYNIEKNKVEQIKDEFQLLNQEISETNQKHLVDMNAKTTSIGDAISGVIKKIGKWSLAIFGIRSAYMFIRQAMSTLSQYNEQLATDIEYIRFAIATTLQPVIEYIIKLVYQLLGLINSIAKAWFGVDLFANASAKAFNKNAKAIGSASKNAKELQKTLAGFDEMNILQADGSTAIGGGGGGVGAIAPSVDLSQIGDADVSGVAKLIDKIKEMFNKGFDNIVENVKKVMTNMGFSDKFINQWQVVIDKVRGMINGFLDFFSGILKMIVGLVTGDSELVKEGIEQSLTGLKDFIVNLIEFVGAEFKLAIIFLQEKIVEAALFIYNKFIKPVFDWFGELPGKMTVGISQGVRNVQEWFNKIPEKLEKVKNKVVEIFKNMGASVGEYVGNAFKNVINAVLARVESTLNKPINTINSLIDVINNIPGVKISRLQNFKLPRLAKGGILNMPGRGVDYYGANISEKGPEAVLPLTDSQQMDLLGESIARHMVVNLTNINQMNGRVISRELQRVQNNNDFAFNR